MGSVATTRLVASVLTVTLSAFAAASGAEVVTIDGATWLRGEILAHDLRVLSERRQAGMVVNLDSAGGQLVAAVAIGRLLRQMKGVARLAAGSSCLSACVYVLAGAPYRLVQPGATVAVHRPYDPDDARLPLEQRQEKQARLDAFVRAYLKEVNVPPALYDAMLQAPAGRTLQSSQLGWYGLDAHDRNFEGAVRGTSTPGGMGSLQR